jgi:Arc/MetJ-type ribon-helix-helix transcriptional regulator
MTGAKSVDLPTGGGYTNGMTIAPLSESRPPPKRVEPSHTLAMAKYEKIAISLPMHAAERVRRAVKRGEAASVSAYIVSAIEEKEKVQSREEFLREMMAESGGPPTLEERNWAREKLGMPLLTKLPVSRPRRPRRSKAKAKRQ